MQPEEHSVAYEDLPKLDQYALFQLASVVDGIEDSYNKYQFYRFFQVRNLLTPLILSLTYGASYFVGASDYSTLSCWPPTDPFPCIKQLMQRFIVVDLSNFYFDTAKDRLYTGYVY